MAHILNDSELAVMNIIWSGERVRAMDTASRTSEEKGWKRNTTYTVISRMIDKGLIAREDPGFYCTALVDRDTVSLSEGISIVDRFFEGSLSLFASAFIKEKKLSDEEINELMRIIEENKGGDANDG